MKDTRKYDNKYCMLFDDSISRDVRWTSLNDSRVLDIIDRLDAQELEDESISMEHDKILDEEPPKKVDESNICWS